MLRYSGDGNRQDLFEVGDKINLVKLLDQVMRITRFFLLYRTYTISEEGHSGYTTRGR